MLRYLFGDVVLVPGERSLAAGGRALKVGGRAFDVLLVLVEHRDRVVSKQELFDRVWPKLVVEENNLQVQVASLRKLLGAQAIATVPGRGYRFTLPVVVEGGDPLPPAPERAAHATLPARLPDLYGREADVAAVRALLAVHPLVTIAGAGGIGKTRVAQAVGAGVAGQHPDGAIWVELASLADAALVDATIARAAGVPVLGDRAPRDAALAVLRPLHALLILDNCEHVIDAVAAFVDALCAAAPNVRVLATSQEPLHATHEHVYRLGTLALPDPAHPEAAMRAGAVALFAARARGHDPRFRLDAASLPAVTEICRRLDGIPLAIELAAARLPLLGLDGLRARLDERFRLLTAGSRVVLRRHQTLRAALDWSHALLGAGEQAVFRRLGVFAGSFTLAMAQQVVADDDLDAWAALDHLGALVDKSIVLAEGDPVPRYRLLETTRAFALEKLAAAGETQTLLRRHAQALVDWLEPLVERRRRAPLDPAEIGVYAPEIDNVRAALDWACASGDDTLAVALAGAGSLVWAYGDLATEGWHRCLALRSRIRSDMPDRVVAQFWHAITMLGRVAAKPETLDAARHEVAVLRRMGDEHWLYIALQRLAAIAARRGELADAASAIGDALRLERASWPARHRANLQWSIFRWLMAQRRYAEALPHALRQGDLYAEDGLEENRQQALGANAAECEVCLGRFDEAEARARLAIGHARAGDAGWGHVHDILAVVATLQGRHDEAIAWARAAFDDLRRQGDELRLLETLALNAALHGRMADAAVVVGFVDAEAARTGEVRWPPTAER
ncbi:MAG TPA: winged helix-turn-helix domain-containing protein, partial [Casimicrobiaceae bacterium]|nr:winged helix-turn-helix domain-containing protein [Casimicrobiaceae bacterium]